MFGSYNIVLAQSPLDVLEAAKRGNIDLSARIVRAGGVHRATDSVVRDLTKATGQQVIMKLYADAKTNYQTDSYLTLCVQTVGTGNANYCIGLNPDYCFELAKKSDDKPWTINKFQVTNDLNLDTEKLGFLIRVERPSRQKSRLAVSNDRNDIIVVGDLGNRPGTTITGATVEPSGRVAVSFEHDLASANGDKVAGKVRARSVLTFDTAHFYLPVEYNETYTEASKVHTFRKVWQNEFEGDFCKRFVCTTTNKVTAGGSVLTNMEMVDTIDCRYGPLPAREFTLSAFGFPEPPGLPARNTGWPTYVWALIVAGVCAAIVFGLRRWQSRS